LEFGGIVVEGYFYFREVGRWEYGGWFGVGEGVGFWATVGFMYLLNVVSLVVQNGYLKSDGEFIKW
jgi:hypothetical protein